MKLTMTLCSDTIPGSGEGLAGIIDTDISHDEFGIPYIPAKRIKGILRETAQDLEDVEKLSAARIEPLFGRTGQEKSSAFRIADGYITNYGEIRQFLQACAEKDDLSPIFHREAVLNYYTYTRSQTTLENGVAKKRSLRTFRVLKKDLRFHFEIECPPEYEADLKRICDVTRHFGLSRTRGMGEILLTCDFSSGSKTSGDTKASPVFKDHEMCQLVLTINNLGQMLVSIEVGKHQTSAQYIPGSFILGAFAYKYIECFLNNTPPYKDTQFRHIFLDGQVTCSNAFPINPTKPGKISAFFPTPVSIVKEKDKEQYIDLAKDFEASLEKLQREKKQTKGHIGEFVQIAGKKVTPFPVLTEVEYHHRRPENRQLGHATGKSEEGDFFQYTVLKPKQSFQARITGQFRHLKLLQNILDEQKTFYLGKSKTAQYGKCEIMAALETLSVSNETWKKGTPAVFTLASDMILRNPEGFVVPDPKLFRNELAFIACPENPPDKNTIEIKDTFLQFTQIGGFMGVWNMPKAQVSALAAGSVIVCRNNYADIPINAIENHAFGIRTEEGFGKIKVNWHGSESELDPPSQEHVEREFPDILEGARDLITYILFDRIAETLKVEAVRHVTKAGSTWENISNSFIGKMLLFLRDAQNFDDLKAKFTLRDRARKKLELFRNELYLEKQETQDGPIYYVDEEKFKTALRLYLQENYYNNEHLQNDILDKADIDENFFETGLFELYRRYALHLFNVVKFRKRGEDKNDNQS